LLANVQGRKLVLFPSATERPTLLISTRKDGKSAATTRQMPSSNEKEIESSDLKFMNIVIN